MQNRKRRKIKCALTGALMVCTWSTGCDEFETGPFEVQDQPLQGKINKRSWKFIDGYALERADDRGRFDVFLFDVPLAGELCDFTRKVDYNRPVVEFGTPGETLDIELSSVDRIRFVYKDRRDKGAKVNEQVDDGRLIIDGIDEDTLSGGLVGVWGHESRVDGNFKVKACWRTPPTSRAVNPDKAF